MDCRISKITIDIMTRISLADLKGSMKSLVMVAIFLSLADTVFGRNIVEENIFENGKTDRLEDFARIYGAVRWFMPSDEAMEVDWNAFTLHAVDKVMKCHDNVDFHNLLADLYGGFVPMFEISEKRRSDVLEEYFSAPHNDLLPVWWQHAGAGLSILSNQYASKRVNRDYNTKSLNRLAVYGYMPFRTNSDTLAIIVRLKYLASEHETLPEFNLIFDTYDPNDPMDFLTQLIQGGQKSFPACPEWSEVTYKTVLVENSSDNLFWGIYSDGQGEIVMESMRIRDSEGNDLAFVDFRNAGNKDNSFYKLNETTYQYQWQDDGLHSNIRNLLFEESPGHKEYCSMKLKSGGYVHFPMQLWADLEHTYPATPGYLPIAGEDLDKLKKDKRIAGIADIIVAWNVMKYFSPYLNEQKADWDRALEKALDSVVKGKTSGMDALRKMMSEVNDAHVTYLNFQEQYERFFPAWIEVTDGKAVVSDPYSEKLSKGDILLSMNGRNSKDIVRDFSSLRSGSFQSKRQDIGFYAFNSPDSTVVCRIMRKGKIQGLTLRTLPASDYYEKTARTYMDRISAHPSGYIRDSILYFNAGISGLDEAETILGTRRPGTPVIVDMRFYPSFLIRYIMPYLWPGCNGYVEETPSSIPEVSFLDIRSGKSPEASRKIPDKTYIDVVFLISHLNMSNQEEFLDYVKYNGMACLIGEPTAGICGNINVAPLPGGVFMVFTGERYYSIAGRKGDYFIRGVQPDILVRSTVTDMTEGRDDCLEAAIEYLEGGK